jgi:holo-[acyl-carrier protein] synthase
MIVGVGIDSVDIARFAHWHIYTDKQLLRVFTKQEIEYCRAVSLKSAERFAARFALKEAFFKALSLQNVSSTSVYRCFRAVGAHKLPTGAIELIIDWDIVASGDLNITPWISVTHTKTTATACVILEKKEMY